MHHDTIGAITFSDALVPPVRAGIKTETRRKIKWPPNAAKRPAGFNYCQVVLMPTISQHEALTQGFWCIQWPGYTVDENDFPGIYAAGANWPSALLDAPYKVGGKYWIRETYYAYGYWREVPGVLTPTGKQKMEFVDLSAESTDFPYHYGENPPDSTYKPVHRYGTGYHKRLARFMPKTAARMAVEVTGLAAQHLGDITEGNAVAEGVNVVEIFNGSPHYENYLDDNRFEFSAKESFESLWRKINGNYDPDQWVWAVVFRLLPD